MKFLITPVVSLLLNCNVLAVPQEDTVFYQPVRLWFNAWELVSRDIYKVYQLKPVDFIFFDDQYVYSSSRITVPAGETLEGASLLQQSFLWKKMLHHDSIRLPDQTVQAVNIMSFAAKPTGKNSRPFFIMPLPSFWEKAGITSKELGARNLFTAVFLHEFSHSQQMQNFGKQITWLEKKYQSGSSFSDDIVQDIFSNDSLFKSCHEEETALFYAAAASTTPSLRDSLTQLGLRKYRERQERFFTGKYSLLKEADDLFLTMEGLGQFTMYAWLTHPKGANLPAATAITGVRRGKKWWSQDEGFALFLALQQYASTATWAPEMFGNRVTAVISLLRKTMVKSH
ncbi:MAG TPA: hypothetical protein PLO99_15170 [Chitinophagaceae bacterium]|nr:hypothetical protein [Chitinophagaceae bacterium]